MTFDPYHKWLGIPKDQRPPTHYQLLGLAHGESDPEVIEEAAIRQMSHLRAYQIGAHSAECTRILNEVAKARATLLDPAKRKQYEQQVSPKATAQALGAHGPADAGSPFDQLDSASGKSNLVSVKRAEKSGAGLWIGIGVAAVLLIAGTVAAVVFMNRGGDGPVVQKHDDDKPKPKPSGDKPKPVDDKPKPDDKGKPIEEKKTGDDPPPLGNEPRDRLLAQAMAYWNLGYGGKSSKHPLTQVGTVELRVPAEGALARPGAKVARLDKGYFNAGNAVQASGQSLTLFARLRDPQASWSYAIFARRRGPDSQDINFNLAAHAGTVLFEFTTSTGTHVVRLPLSRLDPKAWHDLLARYDGEWLQLWCDGTLYAEQPCSGYIKSSNTPVLIGAATDGNQIDFLFTGEMEEAALWNHALSDIELTRIFRQQQLARVIPDRPMPENPMPPVGTGLVEVKPGEVYRNGIDTKFFRFSPDGRHVFFQQPNGVSMWNVAESKEVRVLPSTGKNTLYAGAASPDGKQVAVYTASRNVLVWDVDTGKLVQTLPQGQSVTSLAFSPDSARLAAGGGSSKDGASVRIWEVSTGKLVKQIDGFTQPLNVVAMNDTTLYAVDFTRMLYRCSLETGQIENRKQLPSFSPYVRFTSDLKQMVFLKSGRVAVWDVQDDKELRGADLPPAAQPLGPSLQITADARMAMVSTSKPYHIVVLDLVKGTPIKTLEGHDRSIRAVGLAPDGARAFSIDSDKTIRIWKLDDAVAQVAALKPETKPEIKPETPETKPETKFDAKLDPKFMPEWESIKCPSYSAVAITPDGKRAVTAGPGFDVWDLTTGNLIKKISAGADDSAFGSVALSPDGSQALSITGDNLVRLWDLSTGRMVRSHSYGTGRPHCVAWAGNGQVAAVGGKYLYIIDPESLNTKNTVSSSKEGDVLCAAFYGQGSQIVFGHEGGAVRAVPSTGSGTRTVYTQVDGTAVHDVAMTGNIVLSGGVDKLFYVWDTTRGKGERLDGKTIVRAVETSPKGTYALTAGEDKKIRFWHIKTGRMMQAYSGHDATVRAVAFSPNGLFFLSTSEDGALRAWKLPKELGK